MPLFSVLDLSALACFLGAWIIYALALETSAYGKRGLNAQMNRYRYLWMEQLLARDVRIIDTQIVAALQNGNAFFASTSLIAVGGSLTLLHSTDTVLSVIGALPFGFPTTAAQWQVKTMGLAIIFVYAFFKFAWSYRLFNYVAIMVGATPPPEQKDTAEAKRHIERAGRLSDVAGQHFNRGQRAFFFALGYLGWFISPWALIAATIAVVLVMWRRQFASDSRRAIIE
ncbi:MAG TPA: DUF599 family protein [Xanthobacteraceae bacterium]|nr:DUF599 family protein [Xanthobacteraceae bacterium]